MNGLAGPLHGMANQDVMHWLNKLKREIAMLGTVNIGVIAEYSEVKERYKPASMVAQCSPA